MGTVSDEIIFDEYLDKNVVIFSDMNIAQKNGTTPTALYNKAYFDHGKPDWNIQLQNAATSPLYKIPAAGKLEGQGRVEPVALGGIYGKGFWMNGNSQIRYSLEGLASENNYYFGLFIDPRHSGKGEIAQFPQGGSLNLIRDEAKGSLELELIGGGVTERITLAAEVSHWTHLGIEFKDLSGGESKAVIFINGNKQSEISLQEGFKLVNGDLIIGHYNESGESEAMSAWIDELKLIMIPDAEPMSSEIKCNHARGSIVTSASAEADSLQSELVRVELAESDSAKGYFCHTDYTGDHKINLNNLPSGMSSVRDSLLFPEGPLKAGEPRPDSSENPFCLSCHFDETEELTDSLKIKALEIDLELFMEEDSRRQPLQSITGLYGYFPQGWMGFDIESDPFEETPLLIDRLLNP